MVYVILFILLGGCVSPSFSPVEIHQRVAEQVKVLIDSGYLQTPYIEINEVLSNNSSIIYSIKGADSPGSDGAELPSKVMTYKGKYLCFIELDEQEMSRTELFEKELWQILIFMRISIWTMGGYWLFENMKMGQLW